MGRVLHVTATNAGRGAERFALDLRAALASRGWPGDVVAVAAGSPPELDIPALAPRWPSAAAVRGVRARVRQYDVVVAHGSSALPVSAMATWGTATPFVYRNIGDPTAWARSRLARLRVGAALRRAAGVAALTESARRELVARYRLDAARVPVLPTAVDEARFPLAAERPGDAVLAVVGALSPEKDVALAVDAVSLVPEATLLVAGEGPERSALERHADAVAPGRVRFLGAVADVAALYAGVDAVLLTSRTEGLPAVLIEAAMVGRPVAATAVGAVAEVVEHGVTGVLARDRSPQAVADAVRDVLALPIDPAAVRSRAVSRYGLSSVADGWAQLLKAASG